MPDQYTEVTKIGWGKRLGGSIKGIFTGLLLFLAAFFVLFWNEGRYDVSNTAKNATPIDAAVVQMDPALQGTLVAARGTLATQDRISDGQFLQPSDYLLLQRAVEVYAWVEKQESETVTKLGGSQEVTTNYSYAKEWVKQPANSSSFKVSEGHENPTKTVQDVSNTAPTAKVGVYSVQPGQLGLAPTQTVNLSTSTITQLPENGTIASAEYLFIGNGSLNQPQVGDVRIKFSALPSGQTMTVFGKLDDTALRPYSDVKNDVTVYRAMAGEFEESVAQMHNEYTTSIWIFRLVGFLMMWFGLIAIFAPLSVVLDVLPILGKVSRTTVSIAAFLISLVLSLITIVVSMILHNWIAVLVVIVASIAAGVVWYKKRGNTPKTPAAV